MPDNDIIERLRTGGEGRPPTDGEWRSFQRRAHRSVAIRRGGAALALIVLGVGGLLGGDDLLLRTSDEKIDTVRSPDASPTTTEDRIRSEFNLHYWLVHDGVLAGGYLPWEAAPSERPAESLRFLLTRPLGVDLELGETTEIPTGTELRGIEIEDGLGIADFSAAFAGEGSEDSRKLRVAQVVFTLTQFPEIETVQILVEGEPYEAMPEPVGQGDFLDFAPTPIIITEPHDGEVAPNPVVIAGYANVFEGNVLIRVRDEKGNVIADTFTTATCGNGCWGEFSKRVAFEVGERQEGLIEVFWESAEDGSPQDVVSLPVTLVP